MAHLLEPPIQLCLGFLSEGEAWNEHVWPATSINYQLYYIIVRRIIIIMGYLNFEEVVCIIIYYIYVCLLYLKNHKRCIYSFLILIKDKGKITPSKVQNLPEKYGCKIKLNSTHP